MSDDRLDDEPAHSPYGPSGAEGWATCSDYINANAGLPDFTTEPAAEGTSAHAISDYCLTFGFDAADAIGWTTEISGFTFKWTEDDAELLQPGIDYIRGMGGQFFSEKRVDISAWTIPGQFGTLDRGVIMADHIVVNDLKWGRGIPVSPVENKQIMLYALGFWNDIARHYTDATDFVLQIDQPRCSGGGGEWRITLPELQNFGEWIKGRAHLTMLPNPPRTASQKGCIWCRRRRAPGGCETFEEFMLESLGAEFGDLDDPETPLALLPTAIAARGMTPERRSYILSHANLITRWLDQLYDEALADALQGLPTGNQKVVLGNRSPRKWLNNDTAKAALPVILGEKSFTKKLITPTQASKLLTADDYNLRIKPLVKEGERKPEMVPVLDAREAYVPVEANDFDTLD